MANIRRNSGIPSGVVFPFAGGSAPFGYLLCDGSPISRADYPQLFAAIGVSHGSGDGSTTFNLPDYRGRFLRGVDGDAGRDPDKASRTDMASGGNTGDTVGSVQSDAMQGHNHALFRNTTETTFNDTTLRLTADESVGYASQANVYGSWNFTGGSTADPTLAKSSTVGASTESRPKNVNVNYIIKI
jgi:microcystin-dependent protein